MEEPQVVDVAGQPYVAVSGTVSPHTFHEIADRLPEVFSWLAEQGAAPAGPPFFRYRVVDGDRLLVVEAGVPVVEPVPGEEAIEADMLPPGRYATVTHVGHPKELADVTARLLAWARTHGHTWDVERGDDGEHWGARLEVMLTDPAEEPDQNAWRTQLLFRLAD